MKNLFIKHVDDSIEDVLISHRHYHPLYLPESITQKIIDEKKERAAFVLFEQIDTDRLSQHTFELMKADMIKSVYDDSQIKEFLPDDIVECGFLGDQYRFSIWHISGYAKSTQLFEDHAYIRKTVNKFTGSIGRDASLSITELVDYGVIAKISDQSSKDAYAKRNVRITLNGIIQSI